jgi:hypothetical protein
MLANLQTTNSVSVASDAAIHRADRQLLGRVTPALTGWSASSSVCMDVRSFEVGPFLSLLTPPEIETSTVYFYH